MSQGDFMPKEIADAINGAIRDCFIDSGGPDNIATGQERLPKLLMG
jgi:hypothetical protein